MYIKSLTLKNFRNYREQVLEFDPMTNIFCVMNAQGKTILLASHNQTDIDELCDTVCEMDAGNMTMWRE